MIKCRILFDLFMVTLLLRGCQCELKTRLCIALYQIISENMRISIIGIIFHIFFNCIFVVSYLCAIFFYIVCLRPNRRSDHVLAPERSYAIKDLPAAMYSLWVTASTAQGEGPKGRRSKVKFLIQSKQLWFLLEDFGHFYSSSNWTKEYKHFNLHTPNPIRTPTRTHILLQP